MARFFLTIVILAAATRLAGLFLPAVVVTGSTGLPVRFSIAETVWDLMTKQEFLLGFMVVLFSVVLPFTKFVTQACLWRRVRAGTRPTFGWLRALESFGRWSTADVLVIAIAVVMVSRAGVADAGLDYGLLYVTGSLVLGVVIDSVLRKEVAKLDGEA